MGRGSKRMSSNRHCVFTPLVEDERLNAQIDRTFKQGPSVGNGRSLAGNSGRQLEYTRERWNNCPVHRFDASCPDPKAPRITLELQPLAGSDKIT